jgi:hypothetical protein
MTSSVGSYISTASLTLTLLPLIRVVDTTGSTVHMVVVMSDDTHLKIVTNVAMVLSPIALLNEFSCENGMPHCLKSSEQISSEDRGMSS